MICPCGYALKEHHVFCPNCGRKVVRQQPSQSSSNSGQSAGAAGQQYYPQNSQPYSQPGAQQNFQQNYQQSVQPNYQQGCQQNVQSRLLLTVEGLCLYKGKQPIGNLKIYTDKVEFVHGGRNFATSAMVGGLIGGMIAVGTAKETDTVDCFLMRDIAAANKSKHPAISSYIEIVLKDGSKFKYLDRTGKHKKEEMFAAVDAINAQL